MSAKAKAKAKTPKPTPKRTVKTPARPRMPPAGYAGQRYEVVCKDGDGKLVRLGWTNAKDGGSFKAMVAKHPVWRDLVVIDLHTL